MKKTSEQWQKEFPDTIVVDPDGWDRQNFRYSWYEEEITEEEYARRVWSSTLRGTFPPALARGTGPEPSKLGG